MSDRNSCEEYLLGSLRAVLDDCTSYYPTLAIEFNRDYKRLCSAVESHGIKFILDVMPAFRKHFDKCLEKQHLTPSCMCHLRPYKKGSPIPRLLRGLMLRVFDLNGVLRHDPDVRAIRLIRQILGMCRKLRMETSVKDRCIAVDDFFKVDLEVAHATLKWDDNDSFEAGRAVELHFGDSARPSQLRSDQLDLFTEVELPSSRLDPALANDIQLTADIICSTLGVFDPSEWKPRHGPGAVSDQRFGSYKYEFRHWPDRLDRVFAYEEFALANYAQYEYTTAGEDATCIDSHEIAAKLCCVPKTIRVPRLIACEPTSLQWCQQSIRDFFYQRVSRTFVSSFIDFRRQEENGYAALTASRDQSLATIDLSSASDRISCWAIERLFRRSPSLLDALQATRSAWIRQEISGTSPRLHRLRKYSTMGNATTFPVQSVFFLTVALACVLHTRGVSPSISAMKRLGKYQVRVFGDDIVVPIDAVGLVVETLEHLGLRVNAAKTFSEGNFRESCGVDAFNGHDVTTVSILDVPRRSGPGSVISSVDVHNNLSNAGYMCTAAFVRRTVERCGYKNIRNVEPGSGSFGWSDVYYVGNNLKTRFNRRLHAREVYCLQPRVVEDRRQPYGSYALLQYFTECAEVVTSAFSSLGYNGSRPATKLSSRWVQA